MSKKIKVAVVGLGMGKAHLQSYVNNPSCEVIGVIDINQERLEEIKNAYGIKGYTDFEKALDELKLDAISICTPNNLHAPHTIKALKKGLHVLCEKPMAMNYQEAKKMVNTAKKANKILMINFKFRFTPQSVAIKKQIDKGIIGDIYFGRTVWHRRRGAPLRKNTWFTNKELSGGGPLIDLGVHRMDLAMWFMGYPQPVSVNASTYNYLAKKFSKEKGIKYTVEDLCIAYIKFKNNATLIVEASWLINSLEKELQETCLYGTKGSIIQRNIKEEYKFECMINTMEDNNFFVKTLKSEAENQQSPMDYFIECILEKKQPHCSGEATINVMKIIDAIYLSASTGKEIRIK